MSVMNELLKLAMDANPLLDIVGTALDVDIIKQLLNPQFIHQITTILTNFNIGDTTQTSPTIVIGILILLYFILKSKKDDTTTSSSNTLKKFTSNLGLANNVGYHSSALPLSVLSSKRGSNFKSY